MSGEGTPNSLKSELASLRAELSVPRLRKRLSAAALTFPSGFLPLDLEMYNSQSDVETGNSEGAVRLFLPVMENLKSGERAHFEAFLRAEILNLLTLCGPAILVLKGPDCLHSGIHGVLETLKCEPGVDTLLGLVARLRGVNSVGIIVRKKEVETGDQPLPGSNGLSETVVLGGFKGFNGCIMGVDIGGTDVKILVIDQGKIVVRLIHPWDPSPHTFVSGEPWLGALHTLISFALLLASSSKESEESSPWSLVKDDVTACTLIVLSECIEEAKARDIHFMVPNVIGLSFPDVVVDQDIVGGITGKTRGMESHLGKNSPIYWADFNAHIRPLATELSKSLGGIPVYPLADGAVGAILASAAEGIDEAFAISIGTSLAVGLVEKGGILPPYPLYGSHLILNLRDAPWSAHDTTGVRGVAQKGPTQKGMMALTSEAGLYPYDWSIVDKAVETSGALKRNRVSHVMTHPGDFKDLLLGMGCSLGALCAELCFVLNWTPERGPLFIYGRLLEGLGGAELLSHARTELKTYFPELGDLKLRPADGLDLGGIGGVKLPGNQLNAFGQALGAAIYGAGRVSPEAVHPLVARALKNSVAQSRSLFETMPFAGYDVVILSASTERERRIQEMQFDSIFSGLVGPTGNPIYILSVLERWEGGAGNLLGTLHAFQNAQAQGDRKYNIDFKMLFESGEIKVALIHNGGSGKRCSPLVQSENNSRGAIRLPGQLKDGQNMTLLGAVGMQIQPMAASNSGRELDVFWSSQLFFGTRLLVDAEATEHLLTKFVVVLDSQQQLTEQELRDLGIFEMDDQGSVTDFFAQGTFKDQEDFQRARTGLGKLALDMGSFRIKSSLLSALIQLYQPMLEARAGKRDLDPDLTQPLIALFKGLPLSRLRGMEGELNPSNLVSCLDPDSRRRFLSYSTHPDILFLLCKNPQLISQHRSWVGTFDLGSRVHWWRMRRPSELFELILRSTKGMTPSTSYEAIEGGHCRKFMGIKYPIKNSMIGGVFVEGPEVSFENMAKGLSIGGVYLRGSIVRNSVLLSGSSILDSVVDEVAGILDAGASVVMLSSSKRMTSKGAYVYRRVDRWPFEVNDKVEVGCFRPSVPKLSHIVMSVGFEVDGKIADGTILPGNPVSFKTLRDEILPAKNGRSFREAEARGRSKAGISPFNRATSLGRVKLALFDLTGITPDSPTNAFRSLKAYWNDKPDLTIVSRLASEMAGYFLSAAERYGMSVLPSQPESLAAPWSAAQREALAALDVLALISTHPINCAAEKATGPLFGGIIEGLNDTLSKENRGLSARVLYRVFTQVRGMAGFEAFDEALLEAGIEDEWALADYHTSLGRRTDIFPEATGVKHIVVLPRVTIGAEIAIGSALVRRLLLAYPDARISYFADPKLSPLFEGHERLTVIPFKFPRRGGLRSRLQAWVDLRRFIGEMNPDFVVGPDSRADQVGILPVVADAASYFFWENSLSEGQAPKAMGTLLDIHLTKAALPYAGTCRPTLWPTLDTLNFGRTTWKYLGIEGQRAISVKFDVGGMREKSIGVEFEKALLMGLMKSGYYDVVLFDRGFGEGELAHSARLIDGVMEEGFDAVGVTDLGLKGVGTSPSGLKKMRDGGEAKLLAFHGTIGGWAGLMMMCEDAFSFDSVHQHLAAADRKSPLKTEVERGANTVVAFTGYKSPIFPALWSPIGRGKIEIVIGKNKRWELVLLEVLRMFMR